MKRLYRSLPFPFYYVLLVTTGVCLLIILQSSLVVDGHVQLDGSRILLFVTNYFIWAAVVPIVYGVVVASLGSFSGRAIGRILLWGLLFSLVQLLLSNLIYFCFRAMLGGFDLWLALTDFQSVFVRAWSSRFVDFLVITGVLKLSQMVRDYNQERVKNADLQTSLTEARLQGLMMQLNPHFLFNALHATQTLIGVDDKKARSMVNRISDLMRHMLVSRERQFVPFEEELSYVRNYLAVEQERFHDRLVISYQLDPSTLSFPVLNLMLQPLIENAIKHGISQLEGSGTIGVGSNRSGTLWSVTVKNTVPVAGAKDIPSFGIGLSNLSQRLKTAYGGVAALETSNDGQQHITTITMPLSDEYL